jgi:hypothetical protein
MSIHYQLAKALHEELLRTSARDRLAAQSRRARPSRPHHPITAPARHLAALRRLFS